MPGHAIGGIFDKPHVAAISEGGKKEAVIPLEGNRERAKSIYSETGRHLGIKQLLGSRSIDNITTIPMVGKSTMLQKDDKKNTSVVNHTINEHTKSTYSETDRQLGIKQQPPRSGNTFVITNNFTISGSDPISIAQEVRRILAEIERKARSRERGRFADAPVFG